MGRFMVGGGMARRLAATVAAGVICGIVLANSVHAQRSSVSELLAEANRLWDQGRYAEGVQLAERAVALARERRGEEDAQAASSNSATSVPLTPARKTGSPIQNLRDWATEYLNQQN